MRYLAQFLYSTTAKSRLKFYSQNQNQNFAICHFSSKNNGGSRIRIQSLFTPDSESKVEIKAPYDPNSNSKSSNYQSKSSRNPTTTTSTTTYPANRPHLKKFFPKEKRQDLNEEQQIDNNYNNFNNKQAFSNYKTNYNSNYQSKSSRNPSTSTYPANKPDSKKFFSREKIDFEDQINNNDNNNDNVNNFSNVNNEELPVKEYDRDETPGKIYLDKLIVACKLNEDQLRDDINWTTIMAKCIDIDGHINSFNFGGILLGICAKHECFSVATNYYKSQKNHTLASLSSYFKLLGLLDIQSNEEEIFQLFEEIQSKNGGLWDHDTGTKVVETLSKTSKWRQCLGIIDSMKLGGGINTTNYCQVATAAFKNGDNDLGWSILSNDVGHLRYRSENQIEEALIAWLAHCPGPKTEDQLIKLFNFIDNFDHHLTEPLIQVISSYFHENLSYTGHRTTITPKGVCTNCSTRLDPMELSQYEFETLKSAFFTRVLCDSDIFINTNPDELKEYKDFIEKHAPFDFILDGLNIALARGKFSNQKKNLLEMMKHLYGNRVLIIGRKHMLSHWKSELHQLTQSAYIHLINDESQDDPFSIYAALKSGPGSKFISRDYMRAQSFRLLDPEIAKLFKRWRLASQLEPNFNKNGRIFLRPFVNQLPLAQKSPKNQNWHLPYAEEQLISKYDFATKWMCFTPNKKP